ncbi:hypothetical protein I317_06571 [Kwoniella heveanensis CBS 569]|nr:hypothetical protein I317_06571 [Kwoniella heveanensis CBS 569]
MSNATVIQRRHLMALNRVLVPLLACLTTLFILLPGLSGLSAKGVNYYWLRVDYGGGGGGHGGNGGNGTLNFTSDVVVREVTLRAGLAAASASGSGGGLETGTGIGSQMQAETGVWDLGAFGACQHVAVGDLSGTASFPLSILWCLSIQLEGARKRLEAGDAKLIIEERKNHDDDDDDDDGWADKAGKAIWRAWPWNRDDEDDQAKKARVRNEKHRSSSSKYKGKVKAVKKGVENRSKRKEEV